MREKIKKEPRDLRRDFEKQKIRSGTSAGSQGGKIQYQREPRQGLKRQKMYRSAAL